MKIQSHQQNGNYGIFVQLSNMQSDRNNIFSLDWFSFTQYALLLQRMRVFFLVVSKLRILIQLGLTQELSEKQLEIYLCFPGVKYTFAVRERDERNLKAFLSPES